MPHDRFRIGADPLIARVSELAAIGVFEWHPAQGRISATPRCLTLLGLENPEAPLTAARLWSGIADTDRDLLAEAMRGVLAGGDPVRLQVRTHAAAHPAAHAVDGLPGSATASERIAERRRDTGLLTVALEALPATGGDTGILGTVAPATADESDSKWRRLVCYDTLTGLPNRLLFREQVTYALRRAERDRTLVAVLSMDVDQFRRFNETLGHESGDRLLKHVSARVARCLRSEDIIAAGEGLERSSGVARLGGDEFAILLSRIGDPQDAARVARRLLQAVSEPVDIDGRNMYPSVSVGIALYPWDGEETDRLIRCADTALGRAMELGGGRAQFYSKAMNALSADRLALETGLRNALDAGEFVLHYQPRVDGASRSILSNEALIRWNHSERGLVAPGGFIDVAEQSRLIVPIGTWVLEEACRQNRMWQQRGLPAVPISVNISSIQFRDPGFIGIVERALATTGLEPRFLELEITESVVMSEAEDAIRIMRALKELGVRISIDDFGTGFSSLAYLKDFPVDALKVDRSFVHDVTHNPRIASIACAVIDLGTRLGMEVVAEGVETEGQRRFLLEHGCREMQGFLFARPMDPVALEMRWRGSRAEAVAAPA